MRRVKFRWVTALLISLLTLQACSSDEGQQHVAPQPATAEGPAEEQNRNSEPPPDLTNEQQSTNQIEFLKEHIPKGVNDLPETAEEFSAMPVGRFAGSVYSEKRDELKKVLQQFPDIKAPSEEDITLYYRSLLGLLSEDYPDPQEIVNEIKLINFGEPDSGDPRFQFKQQYHVEIVLDASGSMAERAGGKTRMEAAKEAIQAFAKSLPKEAKVALRVYGHKGSGKESDKALSCGKSELVYNMQPYQPQVLEEALNQFKPAGWTPIALALQEAQQDLSSLKGSQSTNIIYLVSDGIETCGGDPAEAAKQLANSDITPIVNVVGFGVDGEGQQQLKQVAQAAGGRFVLIQNQDELQKEFQHAEQMAKKWLEWKVKESNSVSGKHTEHLAKIMQMWNSWHSAATNTNNHIDSAITYLENNRIVSEQIANSLKERNEQHYQRALEKGDEVEAFLQSLSEKTFQEVVDAIQNKYNMNIHSN